MDKARNMRGLGSVRHPASVTAMFQRVGPDSRPILALLDAPRVLKGPAKLLNDEYSRCAERD